jgi:osmotically-inducible protein OsmY
VADREIQHQVERALEWEPSVDATNVAVTAADGVVTLGGEVRMFAEQHAVERVVLSVYGVTAVVNDLEVRLEGDATRTDTEIAQAAVNALTWSTMVPKDRVLIAVDGGMVTLNGIVEWQYQADAAMRAVRDLRGVKGLINNITIQPHVNVADVRTKIEDAFKHSAAVDARRVNLDLIGSKVILTGFVHTFSEREEARRAAWSAPGVSLVDDRLA